ncbi:hypothetical protein [Citrobacter tructae]|uniref:hypothetical protein n=1 Tax=Citrobacter tructae TaxID=2562449 RepID=UPI003F563A4F
MIYTLQHKARTSINGKASQITYQTNDAENKFNYFNVILFWIGIQKSPNDNVKCSGWKEFGRKKENGLSHKRKAAEKSRVRQSGGR